MKTNNQIKEMLKQSRAELYEIKSLIEPAKSNYALSILQERKVKCETEIATLLIVLT